VQYTIDQSAKLLNVSRSYLRLRIRELKLDLITKTYRNDKIKACATSRYGRVVAVLTVSQSQLDQLKNHIEARNAAKTKTS